MHCSGTPPGLSPSLDVQSEFIVEFWNAVRTNDDPGSTTWEVLEDFERRVSECLFGADPDRLLAARLTAQAQALMTGQLKL